MLSGSFSLQIPGVSSLMDKLDGMKANFLAIPANVRMALDRLARVRMAVSNKGPVTVEFQNASQVVENNLTTTQLQWQTAADAFSQLDSLRQTHSLSVGSDTISLAATLVGSVTSVERNANNNIAAVESLARKYLTADELARLNQTTYGAPSAGGFGGVNGVVIAGFLLGATWLATRRR